MFIVLSCMISVSVNFSTFLVIGKTSAVTYQVLGHLKTCLILALGYLVLNNPFSWRNVCGILIALSGMGLYSYACILESQQKAQDNTATSLQVICSWFTRILTVFLAQMHYNAIYWGLKSLPCETITNASFSSSLSIAVVSSRVLIGEGF